MHEVDGRTHRDGWSRWKDIEMHEASGWKDIEMHEVDGRT
jgi:hypothetical protein